MTNDKHFWTLICIAVVAITYFDYASKNTPIVVCKCVVPTCPTPPPTTSSSLAESKRNESVPNYPQRRFNLTSSRIDIERRDGTSRNEYVQLVVWRNQRVSDTYTGDNLAATLLEEFNIRIKYLGVLRTLSNANDDVENTDVFFYVHMDDVTRFAVAKKFMGALWWEDVLADGGWKMYPEWFVMSHPANWV